jgi:hypothetical protein
LGKFFDGEFSCVKETVKEKKKYTALRASATICNGAISGAQLPLESIEIFFPMFYWLLATPI